MSVGLLNTFTKSLVKIIIAGDVGVGKTTLLYYINNRNIDLVKKTVVIDLDVLKIFSNNDPIKIIVCEIGGQETLRSLIPYYLKAYDYLLLMFDITNLDSFINLDKWLKILGNPDPKRVILVGNKIDLAKYRRVMWKDISNFLEDRGIKHYFEISAKRGINIHKFVEFLRDLFIKDFHDKRIKYYLKGMQ